MKPERCWPWDVGEWLELLVGLRISQSVDDLSWRGVGLVLVGLQVRLLDKTTLRLRVYAFCLSKRRPKSCVNLVLTHELQDSHGALQYFEFLLEADVAQSPLSERLDQIVVELERAFKMLKLTLGLSSSLCLRNDQLLHQLYDISFFIAAKTLKVNKCPSPERPDLMNMVQIIRRSTYLAQLPFSFDHQLASIAFVKISSFFAFEGF